MSLNLRLVREVNMTLARLTTLYKELVDLSDRSEVFRKASLPIRRELEICFKKHKLPSDIMLSGEDIKIHLGCGNNNLPGFKNIDLHPEADVQLDLRTGIPAADNSSCLVFSEHFFEHLSYPDECESILHESFRVLRSGGEIVVGVPDCGKIIDIYTTKDKVQFNEIMSGWYQNRKDVDKYNSFIDLVNLFIKDENYSENYSPHFWGYDYEKLSNLLRESGFDTVARCNDREYFGKKRKGMTLYVGAVKP